MMKDVLKISGLWIAIMGFLWCASYMIGHGFYSAKSLVQMQENIRIIDHYITKEKPND